LEALLAPEILGGPAVLVGLAVAGEEVALHGVAHGSGGRFVERLRVRELILQPGDDGRAGALHGDCNRDHDCPPCTPPPNASPRRAGLVDKAVPVVRVCIGSLEGVSFWT
jgi:hypothetical protein